MYVKLELGLGLGLRHASLKVTIHPKNLLSYNFITSERRADLMAGLVVKLGLGETRGSYVKPGLGLGLGLRQPSLIVTFQAKNLVSYNVITTERRADLMAGLVVKL